MRNSSEILGKRVGERLSDLGWNQSDLAEKAKASTGQISRWLSGEISPGIDSLDRIARALRVTPAWLIADDAETEHPIEECVRRVGAAAIRGSVAPGKGAADTAAHLKREPESADVLWVLDWIQTQPRGPEFVERLADDFRAKAQAKAKRESQDP